jgi:hypothetical protein
MDVHERKSHQRCQHDGRNHLPGQSEQISVSLLSFHSLFVTESPDQIWPLMILAREVTIQPLCQIIPGPFSDHFSLCLPTALLSNCMQVVWGYLENEFHGSDQDKWQSPKSKVKGAQRMTGLVESLPLRQISATKCRPGTATRLWPNSRHNPFGRGINS